MVQLCGAKVQGKPLAFKSSTPKSLKVVISNCLHPEPALRPKINEIIDILNNLDVAQGSDNLASSNPPTSEIAEYKRQVAELCLQNEQLQSEINHLKSEFLKLNIAKPKQKKLKQNDGINLKNVVDFNLLTSQVKKVLLGIEQNLITTVDLDNFGNDDHIGDDGAIALATLLRQNYSITVIDLGCNSITSRGVIALAESLKVNSSITEINLGYNSITADGAFALAKMLKVNSTITKVNLEKNSIGPEGAIALAEALKVNCSLLWINLWDNSIGDQGAIALATALKMNCTLTEVHLWDNCIGTEGAIALTEALKVNSKVAVIDLEFNTIELDIQKYSKKISHGRIRF
ncbi:hypothetical protein GEMRC1_006532 [Eukaryota sp. GEM-RC1]